ncbi:MAG TPA: diaminopimelate decarboxylase [Candidatus Omnitrophica bacterium]|nr:diaminopimelate decarboxylase [Candidatus Omnitrophota bacterium]
MHYFIYKKNELYCENLKVKDLVKEFDTPLYIYSARTILEHFYKIKKAFSSLNPLICYSVKANSNLSILKLLVGKGSGLDIVSGGELYRAKLVRCPPKKNVYASVGKTEEEVREAVKYGILLFNVESLPELERINRVAKILKKKIKIALRINPDIEPKTHLFITTGKKETKFGIDIETAKEIFKKRSSFPFLEIIGIHIHIGSQITQSEPFVKAIKKVRKIFVGLKKEGIPLKYFNLGGGLGIVYDKERPQTAEEFAKKIIPLIKDLSCKIILEPGRFIVGNAGILVTKVLYIKDTPFKKFIIVDAAMNDLIRPALYGAYHKILPVEKLVKNYALQKTKKADVVGPICESGDFLARDRKLEVKEGDCLAVFGAGAYGFSMSSNYNSRRRCAEVLVKDGKVRLIRKRESYKDLVSKEIF